MLIYPLSNAEDRAVRWATRVVPAVAVAVILLMSAISAAAV